MLHLVKVLFATCYQLHHHMDGMVHFFILRISILSLIYLSKYLYIQYPYVISCFLFFSFCFFPPTQEIERNEKSESIYFTANINIAVREKHRLVWYGLHDASSTHNSIPFFECQRLHRFALPISLCSCFLFLLLFSPRFFVLIHFPCFSCYN